MFRIDHSKKIYYKRPLKWFLLLLYSVIFYLILPVSLAIFIAYLAYPLLYVFNRYIKLPFWLAAIVTEVILILSICSMALLSLQSIVTIFPSLKDSFTHFSISEHYNSFILSFIQEKSITIFNFFISKISYFIQSALQSFIELFIFIIALFFALFESRKSRTWFFIYAPPAYREEWKNYFIKAMKLFSYFMYVEFQLLVLTFLLLCGGLYILGFEQAISKAFLISLVDSLPFFGIGIFLIPMCVYYLFMEQPYVGLMLLMLYIFIQLTRQLAESMLWASTLHLRTVHTFFISAASILLFGFYGILLSPLFLFLAVRLKDKANATIY